MTLDEGKIGSVYQVESVDIAENVERRLQALGFFEGTSIELLNKKKNGTTIFKVRGTRLAVGHQIAEGITITGGDD